MRISSHTWSESFAVRFAKSVNAGIAILRPRLPIFIA
jgi:hypothetical protein